MVHDRCASMAAVKARSMRGVLSPNDCRAHAPCIAATHRLYGRRRQPTARVPSMARVTIFRGTLSELIDIQ
jgi:hypothetical protein